MGQRLRMLDHPDGPCWLSKGNPKLQTCFQTTCACLETLEPPSFTHVTEATWKANGKSTTFGETVPC